MPSLSAHAITSSSRIDPPGSAMYETPLAYARSILSLNGKKASEPSETPEIPPKYFLCSSAVNGSGRRVK